MEARDFNRLRLAAANRQSSGLDAANQKAAVADVLLLAISTGIRVGEILNVRRIAGRPLAQPREHDQSPVTQPLER